MCAELSMEHRTKLIMYRRQSPAEPIDCFSSSNKTLQCKSGCMCAVYRTRQHQILIIPVYCNVTESLTEHQLNNQFLEETCLAFLQIICNRPPNLVSFTIIPFYTQLQTVRLYNAMVHRYRFNTSELRRRDAGSLHYDIYPCIQRLLYFN